MFIKIMYKQMALIGVLSLLLSLCLASTALSQGDTWTSKTPMPTARFFLASSEVNGIIYVIGGADSYSTLSTVEAYNPDTDTWTAKADMPTARCGFACCSLNGKIYAIGGKTLHPAVAGGGTTVVEEYDPVTDSWQSKADLPAPARAYMEACSIAGKIYVTGGMEARMGEALSAVEVYDPTTNTWSKAASMPTGRNYIGVTLANGKFYVIGGAMGYSQDEIAVVEEYSPDLDKWTAKQDMPTARMGLAASSVNGMVYAIGGSNGFYVPGFNIVEEYDPATDSWVSRTDMPTPRVWHTSCAVDGKIYAIGGTTNGYPSGVVATVEEYTPLMTGVSNYAFEQTVPKEFKLYQNCPNPFNPTTTINYSLAKDSDVKIMVYNTLGQIVADLVDGFQSKGSYNVKWDAQNQPSGLYIYRLETDGFSAAKKMFLQKQDLSDPWDF